MWLFNPDAELINERAANRDAMASLIKVDNFTSQLPNGILFINGVALPDNVINQLVRRGFNPEWCTYNQLFSAEQESLVGNGTVFNDPYGNDFYDDLVMTEEKIEGDDGEIEAPSYRMGLHIRPDEDHVPDHGIPTSFAEIEKRRRKEKSTHGSDDSGHSWDSHSGL